MKTSTQVDHVNDRFTETLCEAKALLFELAEDAGRSPEGRHYDILMILMTDLDKLLAFEAYSFPRDMGTAEGSAGETP